MSFSVTDETLIISLPTIPSVTTYPLSVSIPLPALRTFLRLVVIVATYLLFRPQLERLFRRTMGAEDTSVPQSVEGMRRQMKELEDERGTPIGGGRKIAIATTSGTAAVGGQQPPKPRRKA